MTARLPHAVVLTYHDFVERRDASALWFDCTADEFESQLDWLRSKGARFASLDELEASIQSGKPLPPKTVFLTFADGYEGFYQRAWPILRRRKIPATMFVHTGFVGDRHGRPKMAWDRLIALDRSGLVSIASQTVTHPTDLRALSNDTLRKEFSESRKTLETRLGHSVVRIAYPNGKCDERCAMLAAQAGYRLGFSEVLAPIDRAPSALLIPRYVHTKYRRAWTDCVKDAPSKRR